MFTVSKLPNLENGEVLYLPNADEHATEVRMTRTPKAAVSSILSLLGHHCLQRCSRWLTSRLLKHRNHQQTNENTFLEN
jgi:hypothetical protein